MVLNLNDKADFWGEERNNDTFFNKTVHQTGRTISPTKQSQQAASALPFT